MHHSLSSPLIWLIALLAIPLHPGMLVAGTPHQAAGTAPGSPQAAAPQSALHIYRVSVFRAAPGQLRNVEKLLTSTPAPGSDSGDVAVVFRHRQGHEWDFMTVEHMGAQATISVAGGPPAQPDSPLSQSVAWHGDTYAAGPPLEEFRRALNLTGTATQGGAPTGVYVVADFMAAVGHRGGLRQVLDKIAAETPGRTITLSHVQGAPWNFLTITRYDSWRQFADEEEATDAKASKDAASDRGAELREHLALHHDTFATIQTVTGSAAR